MMDTRPELAPASCFMIPQHCSNLVLQKIKIDGFGEKCGGTNLAGLLFCRTITK